MKFLIHFYLRMFFVKNKVINELVSEAKILVEETIEEKEAHILAEQKKAEEQEKKLNN